MKSWVFSGGDGVAPATGHIAVRIWAVFPVQLSAPTVLSPLCLVTLLRFSLIRFHTIESALRAVCGAYCEIVIEFDEVCAPYVSDAVGEAIHPVRT